MTQVRAIVMRAAGTNCDAETQYALELAGAKAMGAKQWLQYSASNVLSLSQM